MNVASFAALLQQAIGLDAASIGTTAIERAVLARLASCKLDERGYRELLGSSATELQNLVEQVVVPETWFFRDREAFRALANCALEQWLPTHPDGELRLLSLPCSTGEEPYSMAMALLQARFPADRYSVDAVDISAAALGRAKEAEYGKNSFRGTDLAFREHFFAPTALGFRLDAAVRERVTFHQGNLFGADALPGIGEYDFIFCRNLLIYFDRERQNRAVRLLAGLLRPHGVLFVGPSESGLMFDNGFVSLRVRLAFAFSPPEPEASEPRVAPHANTPRLPKARPVRPAASAKSRRQCAQRTPPAQPAQPPQLPPPVSQAHQAQQAQQAQQAHEAQLAAASQLADRGDLAAATQACHALLLRQGDSVDALHLMGLIRAADGDLQGAAQFYRKALYLDPTHHDTLLHLGLLLEKQGDAAGARLLRDRIRRLLAADEAS
jgi:chemotaxis protein methyltransferase WspC